MTLQTLGTAGQSTRPAGHTKSQDMVVRDARRAESRYVAHAGHPTINSFSLIRVRDGGTQCDELTPRCSRCERMNLDCQYRKTKDLDSGKKSLDFSSLAQTLAPAEVELFNHYLEHTSKDPSVDGQEQYALQVGIPRLACQSKPLMKSILALAAVCKCRDIIGQPSPSQQDPDRGQVIKLLSLAQRYHLESLREIQTTLHETRHYDCVLANAAMMGLYGSASHYARIWLAKTATPDSQSQPLCDLTAPGYPQWVSLFRAARLASASLLDSMSGPSTPSSPVDLAGQCQSGDSAPSPVPTKEQQTRTTTSHALAPILAATLRPALAKLHEKATFVQQSITPTDDNISQLQACLTALSIFDDIATISLLPPPSANTTTNPNPPAPPPPTVTTTTPSHLPDLPPWLHHYTANISSIAPSPLPRRTIMSFIHKVPGPYLDLVDGMMCLVQRRISPCSSALPSSSSPSPSSSSWSSSPALSPSSLLASPSPPPPLESESAGKLQSPSLIQQLAVEVFAHWLVLVMLLDGVWWIGGVGAWELERVVRVRRVEWGCKCLWEWDGEGGWWPEEMSKVWGTVERFR